MLEIPEAIVIANQLNQTISGKRINNVIAASSPHKFAWYYGDPSEYHALLHGRKIEGALPCGGRIEINAEGAVMHFGDGVNLRFYGSGEKRPPKHQLLIEFEDDSALIATVAMYGGMWCFLAGQFDNIYYRAAKESVPPLSEEFDYDYFLGLFDEKSLKMSAKAFLATEQRIPGLGNGVLQDILLNAKIHPKKKINLLTDEQKQALFNSVKTTLAEMVRGGGRDTERDLYGNFGGYTTKLSKNNKLLLCADCGGAVRKETYLGGSIYYCENCQER